MDLTPQLLLCHTKVPWLALLGREGNGVASGRIRHDAREGAPADGSCFLPPSAALCAVGTWLLFLLYTPFGIWMFASRQYNRLRKMAAARKGARVAWPAAGKDRDAKATSGRNGEGNVSPYPHPRTIPCSCLG